MPPTPESLSCDELVSELLSVFENLEDDQQHWIGLAGPPGSGKSTITDKLSRALSGKVTIIAMDGYHTYKEKLDAHGLARRGAPFTFEVERFCREICEGYRRGSGSFPIFDHEEGDPDENKTQLSPGKQVVVVEGNYLLLAESPWDSMRKEVFGATDVLDEAVASDRRAWYLDVPIDECMQRVEDRHVEVARKNFKKLHNREPDDATLERFRDEARERVASNDRPNAMLVRESSENADRILQIHCPRDA